MIIEALIEQSIIDALQSELGDDVQLVGSRLQTKVEDADKKTIIAVASAFRNHDAFSLSLVNVPIAISVATRVEGDAQSQEHNATVEKVVDLLVNWHKDGEAMSDALTNRKFLAGELRMDGGTTQTFDREHMCWTDSININIRGAEKFAPPPDPSLTLVTYVGGHTAQYSLSGTLNSEDLPNRDVIHYVEIGSSIDEIGERAFRGMEFLMGVEIPTTVTAIGAQAFSGAEGMPDIEIPSSVSSIGSDAFYGCHSLSSVTFDGKTLEQVRAMENFSWGLQNGCVIHCSDGDIVVGAETVVQYRSGLIRYLDIDGQLTYRSIPSVIYAKEVVVGNMVTSIGEGAFEQCSNLTNVNIPGSVKTIGDAAFLGCTALTSLAISEGVETIEGSAFTNCRSLANITIPSSVTSIGDEAFFSCEALRSVTFRGKDRDTVQGMSDYSWRIPSGCVLHCTDGDITI